MVRKCYKCERPGGSGKRELRPYGPNGADVCAGCVFGEDGKPSSPRLVKQAEEQLAKRMLTDELLVLDPSEQVGPRPLRGRKA